MRLNRRGFSMIELLVAFIVFSILASLAILRYIDLKRTATSARVASDFNTVKVATYTYWADNATWPNEVGPGVPPPELVSVLPTNFTFVKPNYTLDYEYFPVPGSGPNTFIVGVTVTSTDAKFMTKLEQILGRTTPFMSVGGSLTYIIVGADGAI
jgi:prepilin-type N-terminal cleavage/methylation domain-containing protein